MNKMASQTILSETQTLTEARGESSDADRNAVFAETQTASKATGESRDEDEQAWRNLADWERGDRRPLLFDEAFLVTKESPTFGYDRSLAMAVDESGAVVINSGSADETATESAARGETDDNDR